VAVGQTTSACHVLCAPEFNVEPTFTFTKLFGSARIVDEHGTTTREPRETEFEVILSLGLPTRAWMAVAFSTEPAPGRSPSLWSSRSPPFSNLEQSDAAFVLRLLMRWTGESFVKDWDGDIRRQQSSESPMIQPWRSRLHSDVEHRHVREDHSEQAFFVVA